MEEEIIYYDKSEYIETVIVIKFKFQEFFILKI